MMKTLIAAALILVTLAAVAPSAEAQPLEEFVEDKTGCDVHLAVPGYVACCPFSVAWFGEYQCVR